MANYVYIRAEKWNGFSVGFYDPKGRFIIESEYDDKLKEKAAHRVHFLNGGTKEFDESPF